MNKNYKGSLGVVVGRFQVPMLHEGHRHLLDHAEYNHQQILVVLGTRNASPTPRDPLSFQMRKAMISRHYPSAIILPLADMPSDDDWSKELDLLIEGVREGRRVTLYGARDSFVSVYNGKFKTKIVDSIPNVSGRDLRCDTTRWTDFSEEFRRGVIHTHMTRYPITYPVVDVAVIRPETNEVLLGGKSTDSGKWRFIGGFVDPNDESFESAAKREVIEETSDIEVDDFRYIGSQIVEDHRYRKSGDAIMTTFFRAQYIFGAPRPKDDIVRLQWFPLEKMIDALVPQHKSLGEMLLKNLASEKRNGN